MDESRHSGASRQCGAFQSVLPFTDVSHAKELLSVLLLMRSNDDLCDVTLLVEHLRIRVHKAMLAACSPYFRAMFTGNLAESGLDEVVIHVDHPEAFSQIIDYFYSSNLTITEANVEALVSVADMLQVPRVQHACCEIIKRKLTPENCLGISAFADMHNCTQLAEHAHDYAIHHFLDVVQASEFMKISTQHLSRLISDDGLSVSSEERVFEAVIAWIAHNTEERKRYAGELFQHVRFPLLHAEFLMDRVACEGIIRDDRVCSDLLFEATRFLLLPKRRSNFVNARVLPRKSTAMRYVMYAIGGMSRREAMKTAERYDLKEGRWKSVGEMSINRFGADVAAIGSTLFICGGSDDTTRLKTAERYDPQNNVWIPMAEMSSNRNGVGVTTCNGKIYAIGGFNGSTPLNSAECYDTKTGKWMPIAAMNQARFGVGCCTSQEQIYAVGGSDGNNLRTCERYSVETDAWLPIAPMSVARKQVTCAALNRHVYAIGGCDYAARYQSVERYDPSLDQWVAIAPLLSPRSGAGVGVMDGFLFVCGGFDGNQYLNTVEKYDPLTDHWYAGPPMNFARDGVAVCVATYKKPHCRRFADLHAHPNPPPVPSLINHQNIVDRLSSLSQNNS